MEIYVGRFDLFTFATLLTTQQRGLTDAEVWLPFLNDEEAFRVLTSGDRRISAEEAAPFLGALWGMPLLLTLARKALEQQRNNPSGGW